jgi:hypothetical protein
MGKLTELPLSVPSDRKGEIESGTYEIPDAMFDEVGGGIQE